MTDITVLALRVEQGVEVLVALHCKPIYGRDSRGRFLTMDMEMEVVLALDGDGYVVDAVI